MAVKNSGRLALAGVLTALALVLLLLTAVIPTTTVALAAAAGLCGIPVVVELGRRAGLLHYMAVSLLALLLIPAVEGKTMYIAFFGYYTVLKAWLEQKNLLRPTEWIVKLVVFIAALGAGGAAIWFISRPALPGWFALWMLPVAAVGLCALFVVYDWCLTGLVSLYNARLRPQLQRLFRF